MPPHNPLRRALAAAVLAAAGAASVVQAQVNVSLKTDRKHYLRYEPVGVTVVLRNYSGNTLLFSDEPGPNRGSLRFIVQRPEGQELRPRRDAGNPVADLVLGAGETRQLAVQLNEFFDLRSEGPYLVSAQLSHQRLPNDYLSQPAAFDVREGVPVITRDLGLPQTDGGAPIKAVTAQLLLFHDGERWQYCLRAETEDAVLGTVRLGPQIAGTQPQMDADAASDVHVLVQLQARLCLHAVYGITETGLRLRQRRYYRPDQYGPRLTQAPGYLKVVGGIPVREGIDMEPLPLEETGAEPGAAAGGGQPPAPQAAVPAPGEAPPAAGPPQPPPPDFGGERPARD